MPEQLQFIESAILSKSGARQQAAVGAVRISVVERLAPLMYALTEVGLKVNELCRLSSMTLEKMSEHVTHLAIPISNDPPHASDVLSTTVRDLTRTARTCVRRDARDQWKPASLFENAEPPAPLTSAAPAVVYVAEAS